jgi:hypothetical protein
MMNAAGPTSTISGGNHHASARSVRCGIWTRVGEKTPVRTVVGVLIDHSASICLLLSSKTGLSAESPRHRHHSGIPCRTRYYGRRVSHRRIAADGFAGHVELAGVDIEPVEVAWIPWRRSPSVDEYP